MIYVTGDTHGKPARLTRECMPFADGWGKGDTLIVCGDFGYLMSGSPREELFLRELSFRPYTVCFLDGNRENFDLLEKLKVSDWRGGKAHRLRRNVVHLMRGQVYRLEGKRLFTMGGGYSIDRLRRFEGVDWWARELPSGAEYELARENLLAEGMEVDYILTHAAPASLMRAIAQACPEEAELNHFLEWVKNAVRYNRWYFGHLHMDAELNDRMYALFTEVRELTTGELVW